MPQMPLNDPVVQKDGKISLIWMRHFFSTINAQNALQASTTALQDQTANLANQTASIQANGPTMATQLSTQANNSAAIAAGLTAGTLYKTANGSVQVVY